MINAACSGFASRLHFSVRDISAFTKYSSVLGHFAILPSNSREREWMCNACCATGTSPLSVSIRFRITEEVRGKVRLVADVELKFKSEWDLMRIALSEKLLSRSFLFFPFFFSVELLRSVQRRLDFFCRGEYLNLEVLIPVKLWVNAEQGQEYSKFYHSIKTIFLGSMFSNVVYCSTLTIIWVNFKFSNNFMQILLLFPFEK